jgi:hypothetical protein
MMCFTNRNVRVVTEDPNASDGDFIRGGLGKANALGVAKCGKPLHFGTKWDLSLGMANFQSCLVGSEDLIVNVIIWEICSSLPIDCM